MKNHISQTSKIMKRFMEKEWKKRDNFPFSLKFKIGTDFELKILE
jgi:hypothetical protein